MQQLMKQAQKMQEQMAKAQEELEEAEIVGESGGGLVKVTVNGKKVNIPSYLVKAGDVIAVVDKSKENGRFKLVKEEGVYGNAPKWLEVDAEKLTAKVVALPTREDIDYPVEEHLIVEFYSR